MDLNAARVQETDDLASAGPNVRQRFGSLRRQYRRHRSFDPATIVRIDCPAGFPYVNVPIAVKAIRSSPVKSGYVLDKDVLATLSQIDSILVQECPLLAIDQLFRG